VEYSIARAADFLDLAPPGITLRLKSGQNDNDRPNLDWRVGSSWFALGYGQRLAVSSHPAARAGCGPAFTAACGMRIGC
jgi:hypothetical protein